MFLLRQQTTQTQKIIKRLNNAVVLISSSHRWFALVDDLHASVELIPHVWWVLVRVTNLGQALVHAGGGIVPDIVARYFELLFAWTLVDFPEVGGRGTHRPLRRATPHCSSSQLGTFTASLPLFLATSWEFRSATTLPFPRRCIFVHVVPDDQIELF